jgi:hypothetical protein
VCRRPGRCGRPVCAAGPCAPPARVRGRPVCTSGPGARPARVRVRPVCAAGPCARPARVRGRPVCAEPGPAPPGEPAALRAGPRGRRAALRRRQPARAEGLRGGLAGWRPPRARARAPARRRLGTRRARRAAASRRAAEQPLVWRTTAGSGAAAVPGPFRVARRGRRSGRRPGPGPRRKIAPRSLGPPPPGGGRRRGRRLWIPGPGRWPGRRVPGCRLSPAVTAPGRSAADQPAAAPRRAGSPPSLELERGTSLARRILTRKSVSSSHWRGGFSS